jgi:hypothetical protein
MKRDGLGQNRDGQGTGYVSENLNNSKTLWRVGTGRDGLFDHSLYMRAIGLMVLPAPTRPLLSLCSTTTGAAHGEV